VKISRGTSRRPKILQGGRIGPYEKPTASAVELAAMTGVANVLRNLNETIAK